MKTNTRNLTRWPALVAILALAISAPAQAQVLTGFETANGYTDGQTVYNPAVNDTGIPGNAVWQDVGGAIASSANPQSGDLALRIQSDGTKVFGTRVDLSGAGLVLDDTAAPITLSFSMAISSYSAGTGNQVQVYFGNNTINPTGASYWSAFIFSNGNLQLFKGNATGNNTSVNLGDYTTYSNLGEYINVDITLNPVTKTYESVLLSGTKSSSDLTSSVAGLTVPWLPASASADPAQWLQFVVGGNDTVTVDFDNLSLANIPEPSTAALLGGAAGLLLAATRRHRLARTG